MIFRFLPILILLSICSTGKSKDILKSGDPNSTLECIVTPGQFAPLPLASSTFWRTTLPEELRASYIALGEQHLGKAWTSLPATLFSEYKNNGNRIHYENACFAKRRKLAEVVMAEVAEGKGRFLDTVIDGLWSHLEETWWGIPAHYDDELPHPENQTVDLFNAETASLIAWTSYILSDSLDSRVPTLRKRINEEISRRILKPALSTDYWWKQAGMNWNPWICSNWLTCILFCETNRNLQLSAIQQVMKALDIFMASYPEDGGCDEGPGYWDRAAASLYESLHLLHIASNGKIGINDYPKLCPMGSYAYKAYIGNGYCINFSDSHDNKSLFQVNILYPFGVCLHDDIMKRFAKFLWNGDNNAGTTYSKSGNFPSLGRELFFLSLFTDFQKEVAQEPLLDDIWLPNLQIMAARSKDRLYLAMKGGHNDESHNHNDVGSFIVYADGEPLLIDPGVGEYTSKTFSSSRYEIWTMQSAYHNLPQINGCDQSPGKTFAAKNVRHGNKLLSMDLAGVYPDIARVRKWQRTVRIRKENAIEVDEQYELVAHTGNTCVFLMTVIPPVIQRGKISLGSHCITFDPNSLVASAEDVSSLLDPLLTNMWGGKMYRIKLTLKNVALKGNIRYRIE